MYNYNFTTKLEKCTTTYLQLHFYNYTFTTTLLQLHFYNYTCFIIFHQFYNFTWDMYVQLQKQIIWNCKIKSKFGPEMFFFSPMKDLNIIGTGSNNISNNKTKIPKTITIAINNSKIKCNPTKIFWDTDGSK